jgi:hypothetical protein
VPADQYARTEEDRRGRRRRAIVLGALSVLVLLALNAAYQVSRSIRAGTRGKTALLRAEEELSARHPDVARQQLMEARAAFQEGRSGIAAIGPLLPLARIIPFLRIQVRGAEAFADAGVALSEAGIGLSNSASAVLNPPDGHLPVAQAVDALRGVHASLERGVKVLNGAIDQLATLNGYRLIGPIASARDELATEMPRISARATSAERGMNALLVFAGGSGARRYLFLSQNPDEVRPTGGFIGTYGVLVADPGQLKLERFEAIDPWLAAHPDAIVPADQAPSALRLSVPPSVQRLANVNAGPDWPQSARLAADLWKKGGETPVDGVVSVTPGFLARLLAVLGPVEVPSYHETVSTANVVERFDFYTRQVETKATTNAVRKDFVAELAQIVMTRLLSAPASQWDLLAQAIGTAFDQREALVWSSDESVAAAAASRGWDGAIPSGAGDFFFGAEFHYRTKNGRGLQRTYDHHIDLRADGSGQVTTNMTIDNPEPLRPLNDQTIIYITAYGPQGAALHGSSDPPVMIEPPVAGHPAAGWFRGSAPLSKTTLKVVWDVPHLASRNPDGSWTLDFYWRRLPDHAGDVLNLTVTLPSGWTFEGARPPPSVNLERDVIASWKITP